MTAPANDDQAAARQAQLLQLVNSLVLKAVNADSRKSLRFIILNDTIGLIRYDRSILWSFESGKPKLEGISGQSKPSQMTELAQDWTSLLHNIKDLSKPQALTKESFKDSSELWDKVHESTEAGVIWLPIHYQGEVVLGLWIERWKSNGSLPPPDILKLLTQYLSPAYGGIWHQQHQVGRLRRWLRKRKSALVAIPLITLALLFGVRVPLRIVAPCEIIAKNPYSITAPMEGIIKEIAVAPGAAVKVGQPLYSFQPEVIEQNMRVAENQVELMQGAVNRTSALGHRDPDSLRELSLMKLRLQQETARRDLAKHYQSLLEVAAPIQGVVVIANPEDLRGRPVKVGDTVMTLSDPDNTKVRMWLPESDNIAINSSDPIKVYLNVDPSSTYYANLSYVAHESSLSDQQVPSFVADAKWDSDEHPPTIGLKGSAVLYGDNVSLCYFLFRRPWTTIRNFIGI